MKDLYKITVVAGENQRTLCGNLDATPKDWFKRYDKAYIESDGQKFLDYVSDDFSYHGEVIRVKRVSRHSDSYLNEAIERGEKYIKTMTDGINEYRDELKKEYIEYEVD